MRVFRSTLTGLWVVLAACSPGDTSSSSTGTGSSGDSAPGTADDTGAASDGGTGGASDTAMAGCDAEPPADPVPPTECENPQPQVVENEPTGWVRCDNGLRYREMALDCPMNDLADPSDYECTNDSECGDGQICSCLGNAAQCVDAHCVSDPDCLAGYHCWERSTGIACDGPFDQCRVEPCVNDGTVCELCEYVPQTCAMDCVDYGPCTG